MTFFLHKMFGASAGGAWSAGVITQGSISEAAAQTAWHTGVDNMWAAFTADMPTNSTVTLTQTSTASPAFKQTTGTTNTEALAGTSASVSLPGQICERITHVTAQKTKAGTHSGFDLPPMATNAVGAAGVILAAAVTNLVTGAKALYDSLVLSGLTPVSVNKTTLTTIAVTSFKVRNTFVVQRRRVSKQATTYTTSGL